MNLIKKGSTDVTRYIMLVDSTAGTPETGYTITSLDLQYTRNRTAPAAKVDATALAATDSAHGDNQAIQVDATSSPGLYRVDWPDAAFATGADKVILVVSGTGLAPAVEEIQLIDVDLADTVRMGLTALPNAAADAAGGLPISDAGGLDLDTKLANTNEVTAARMGALTDWIDGGRLDLIIDAILADTADMQPKLGTPSVTLAADIAAIATPEGTVLVSGTIGSTGNDTTHLHLDTLTYGDDELNNHLIAVYDDSTTEWHARWITDWVLSTELATLNEALPFTPEDATDRYVVLSERDDSGAAPLSVAAIVDAIWDELLSGHTTAGSAGQAVSDILADTGTDGVVVAAGSKTGYSLTATTGLGNQTADITGNLSGSVGSVTGAVGSVTGNVGGNVAGSVGSVTGAVGSVTAGVTVTTNNDKTGYRLSATGVDDVLDEVVEGSYTLRQYLRGFASALMAKLSGAATTSVVIRDTADSKDRVTATVDADGNRSAVTLDLT